MTVSPEITTLGVDDLDEAAALRVSWNGRSVAEQAAYLRWKYQANPLLPTPLVALARIEGRLVGMRGFYGTLWQRGPDGTLHMLPAAAESYILPEHRRGGELFRMLNEAGLDLARNGGYSHVVNLSASPEHAMAATMHFGWKAVVREDTMSRCGRRAGPRSVHAPARLRAPARRLRSRLGRAPRRHGPFWSIDHGSWGGDVTLSERCPSWIPGLLARCHDPDRLGPSADAELVSWRFSNPWFAYRFLTVGGPTDGAYLSLCADAAAPSSEVVVVDWQGTSAEARALVLAALSAHAPERVEVLTTGLGAAERSALLRSGFTPDGTPDVPARRRPALLVRSTGPTSEPDAWRLDGLRLDLPESWDVRRLSSDAC